MGRITGSKQKLSLLGSCLHLLEGCAVCVETRHDTVIRGKLEECDENINLFLCDVSCHDLVTGRKWNCDRLHVKDRAVRFVHLPEDFDPVHTMLEVDKARTRNQEVHARRRMLMTRKELKMRERAKEGGR
jgi:small nuclear ribonucleoprotein (snRNP)-like protein